jgi:CO/xanthine dehydrogenase Mo-binding subunit
MFRRERRRRPARGLRAGGDRNFRQEHSRSVRTPLSFADFAASAGPVSAAGAFANTKRTYSYGAHAAHVAVESRNGHVEVVDYLAIEDVGRAVKPGIKRSVLPCKGLEESFSIT